MAHWFKNEPLRWCTPIIPGLSMLRQENSEFKTSLGYTVSPYVKKQKKTSNENNEHGT
jgi:hypothetical protein